MQSILQSQEMDTYSQERHFRAKDKEPVPHMYYHVLALHMARTPIREICEETGYAESTIYRILKDERLVAVRQQQLSYLDDKFENLKDEVIQVVADGLSSSDPSIQLNAAGKWLAHHKKEKGTVQVNNVTAENVVMQILQEAQNA